MIIDGRAIAGEILAQVRSRQEKHAVVRAITVAPTPATLSYLRIKEKAAEEAGMTLQVIELPDDATPDQVVEAIQAPGTDAVIVQLPLSGELDEDYLLARIPVDKDADVLSPMGREESALVPPVAAAVREVFLRTQVEPAGKKAVVVGKGRLVGEPVAQWLRSMGVQVQVLVKETFDLPESQTALRAADIIVTGAGAPHVLKPEMIKEGVVLIDAGTSELGGAIVGDIDPACQPLASVFTPVPGGIGPITVACLFRNVLELTERETAEQ